MPHTRPTSPLPAVLLALLTVAPAALAQDDVLADRRETFGAAIAPARLPAGSAAAYGYAGVPEVGAGYRQGFGPIELEARGSLDYFLVAFAAELRLKLPLPAQGRLELSPLLGLGLVWDTGARYIDEENFSFTALRMLGGLIGSYGIHDTVRLLATAEVPLDLTLDPGDGAHFRPLAGGGAEFYIGGHVTAFALAKLGLDVLKEPLGVRQTQLGFQLQFGFGYRLF